MGKPFFTGRTQRIFLGLLFAAGLFTHLISPNGSEIEFWAIATAFAAGATIVAIDWKTDLPRKVKFMGWSMAISSAGLLLLNIFTYRNA